MITDTAYTVLAPIANTPEWLRARKPVIGASEVACILGLSKWNTPLGIYIDKLSSTITDDMTEWQEWGHRLEDAIAQWVVDSQGLTVLPSPGLLGSTAYPWLGATPDRVTDNGEPIELKTSDRFMIGDWENGVPDHYRVQVLVQMIVLGARRGHLAVLHGGNHPEYYVIEWDQDVVDQIIDITRSFWYDNVLAEVPPEPSTIAELDMAKTNTGTTIEGDERLLMAWYLDGLERSTYKGAEERIDAVKAAYKELLATAGGDSLSYGGKPLYTWKRGKDVLTFDRALFEADHPELVQKYTRIIPGRLSFLRKTVKDFEENPPAGWEPGLTVADVLSDYQDLTMWRNQ